MKLWKKVYFPSEKEFLAPGSLDPPSPEITHPSTCLSEASCKPEQGTQMENVSPGGGVTEAFRKQSPRAASPGGVAELDQCLNSHVRMSGVFFGLFHFYNEAVCLELRGGISDMGENE